MIWQYQVAGVCAVVVALSLGSYGLGYVEATKESAKAMSDYREVVHQQDLEQERALEAANADNRKREREHDLQVADLRAEFARKQAESRARDDRTLADLRSGNQRLRIQVSGCSPPAPSPDSGATGPAPAGVDGTREAELAPAAAESLYGIAADGDRAVEKLTALQSWAKGAVELCGGAP